MMLQWDGSRYVCKTMQSYDEYFQHVSFRKICFKSVLTNIGWEYRTEKSGYIYLGTSYHRPFLYFLTKIEYRYRGKDEITSQNYSEII